MACVHEACHGALITPTPIPMPQLGLDGLQPVPAGEVRVHWIQPEDPQAAAAFAVFREAVEESMQAVAAALKQEAEAKGVGQHVLVSEGLGGRAAMGQGASVHLSRMAAFLHLRCSVHAAIRLHPARPSIHAPKAQHQPTSLHPYQTNPSPILLARHRRTACTSSSPLKSPSQPSPSPAMPSLCRREHCKPVLISRPRTAATTCLQPWRRCCVCWRTRRPTCTSNME